MVSTETEVCCYHLRPSNSSCCWWTGYIHQLSDRNRRTHMKSQTAVYSLLEQDGSNFDSRHDVKTKISSLGNPWITKVKFSITSKRENKWFIMRYLKPTNHGKQYKHHCTAVSSALLGDVNNTKSVWKSENRISKPLDSAVRLSGPW